MDSTKIEEQAASAPPKPRQRHLLRGLVITAAVFALAFVALSVFLATESALRLAVDMLVARSEGRLSVVEPAGSLLSTVRAKRLTWKGPEATLSADEVALDWNPFALLSRGIVIRSLGAQRIMLALVPSASPSPPPSSLALPIDVRIDKIDVGQFAWQVGTNAGTITGIAFGYAGGASTHRVDNLSFVSEFGAITGGLTLGAVGPFPIAGALALAGDGILRDARAEVAVSGTLATVVLAAQGSAKDAHFTLGIHLTPLAKIPIETLSIDAEGIDLASWDAALPVTRISLKATAQPLDGGLAGELEAANTLAGAIDAHRLPVRALRTRFSWSGKAISFDDVSAELSRTGRASGQVTVPLTGGAGKWTLDVRDIDLKEIYTPLVTTHLSGTLGADLDANRQQIDGSVTDKHIAGGIGVSFGATIADGKLSVQRATLRAGNGELAGNGRINLSSPYAFDLTAKATHVNPSHFGDFPVGSLDGEAALNGTLRPSWRVGGKVMLAQGSHLSGVAVSGSAHAIVAPRLLRDAAIDLMIASSHIVASGSTGTASDQMTATIDAPRLADLAPFLPARAPHPLSGSLHVKVDLAGDLDRGGIELEAKGQALHVGSDPKLAIDTVNAHISVAPAAASSTPADAGDRTLAIEVAATGIVVPQGTFPRASAKVEGTLARHTASLALVGADLDIDAKAHGGLTEAKGTAGVAAWTWTGVVDALENRGPWAVKLAQPATLQVAHDHVAIGAAHLDVADGKVDIDTLSWDNGRITTRGAYSGVPLATVARLSGVALPFVSTITLGGDWSLAAAPRLNGSVAVHRERGDILLSPDTVVDSNDRAMQVSVIDLSARFHDDAVEATGSIRSERGANANATLGIGATADAPPGHISPTAPLTLLLTAALPNLKALQPWVGTAAVIDGNVRAEISATGTVGHPLLSGTVRAAALRIEAPQHGLYLTDGTMSARLAPGILTLDELSFAGGAGRFTAAGTLAITDNARSEIQAAAAQVTWHAEQFRLFNRPDLRLVVGGSGTLALKDRKLSLGGALTVAEGHVEYTPDPSAELGDDVVIKGREAKESDAAKDKTRTQTPPLTVDLDLDLGSRLTFTGEGLETGLRGKVHVTLGADGVPRGRGSIQTVNGTYFAFGQKLVIDRGQLIFDGPLNNPGLDIVALRKNLAVEAGVNVSGTVKVPIVQLTSNPPVPDNEKLSWLVLGQGLDSTSGADMAALQAASAALLGRNGKPMTTRVAESFGLDDISVRSATSVQRGSTRGTSATSGQVVTFGKRLTDRLTLVYEQGLSVANNALRLEYSLTRTLTLRAEAGAISGVGVFYRRVFE